MKEISLKQKLNERVCLGTFLSLGDPNVVGILARAGFDFILIDAEHFPLNPEKIRDLILAAKAYNIHAVVRLPGPGREYIQHALECGADGILAPIIETEKEARDTVRYSRYVPQGERGFHGGTPGARMAPEFSDYAEYTRQANEDILVGVQLETPAGLENRNEIIETPGVDLVFVGPGDLSNSFGIPGQYQAPEVQRAMEQILGAARTARRPGGMYCANPTMVARARELDARFIVYGADASFLKKAAGEAVAELGI